MKRWLRIGSGVTLAFVGLLGLLLPIFPGWIFLIPGLVILSREFHWARRLLQWARSHLPRKSLQD